MSMFEALHKIRGTVPWLREPEQEAPPPAPPTPIEDAESLVLIAKTPGLIERESPTWRAVAQWAATGIILVQSNLEHASGEQAAALRSRASTLRDLLAIDGGVQDERMQDPGPYVP